MEKVLCDSFGNLAGELCSLNQLIDSYASIPRLSCDQRAEPYHLGSNRVWINNRQTLGSLSVASTSGEQWLWKFGMIGLALLTAVLGLAQSKALDCGESGESCLYIAK